VQCLAILQPGPQFDTVRYKLKRHNMCCAITDREAFDDEYWEAFFLTQNRLHDKRVVVADIKDYLATHERSYIWRTRAPLLLRIIELAREESAAQQIALRAVKLGRRSTDPKNAARQKLFQQLKQIGAPTCKTITQLTRALWTWKLRAQGHRFDEIALDLNYGTSTNLRLALRKQLGVNYGDVDYVAYNYVLHAVADAFVASPPHATAKAILAPLLTAGTPRSNKIPRRTTNSSSDQ
jgi:hypothetical protein